MVNEIHGQCDERFLPFMEAFSANFDEGLELGASLAVTHHGKTVVDLWGGFADRKQTRPWQRDTIIDVFSCTKIMVIISTLMVIDRGLIELDKPVAQYWPGFAAGGKHKVTVREMLTHQGGVPGFDPPVPYEALFDWSTITAHIAATPHWFDGRNVLCYHPQTYGFVLGELIRRVDGRRPAQFFREEIAAKIGADFQIGLASESDVARLAEIRWPPNLLPWPEGSLTERIFNSVGPASSVHFSSWEHRSADMPASNGYGNGRSIAQICSIIAMGGQAHGTSYLSRHMIDQAVTQQVYDRDPGFGWLKMGLGFGLHSDQFPAPTSTAVHWGGYGGSWGVMDPRISVSLGYTPNNFIVDLDSLDPRLQRFSDALAGLAPELEQDAHAS